MPQNVTDINTFTQCYSSYYIPKTVTVLIKLTQHVLSRFMRGMLSTNANLASNLFILIDAPTHLFSQTDAFIAIQRCMFYKQWKPSKLLDIQVDMDSC